MPPGKLIARSAGNLSGPQITVDFINVGQGNCVLVTLPNGNFLLADCGSQQTSVNSPPFKHAQDYIQTVVGNAVIDCVVLSHGDDDHTAFISHITQAASATYLHFGGSITEYGADVQTYIHSLENWKGHFVYRYPADYCVPQPDADFASETSAGEAHTMVLSANYGKTSNSKSIVLLIKFGTHIVVLPGDAEGDTEAFILANVPKKLLADCTVLMPGHHGAYESTSYEWANTLKPTIDAISASGTNMSYAHPACQTNKLLLAYAGAVGDKGEHEITCSDGKGSMYTFADTSRCLLVTATNGDVRFISSGTNWRLLASRTGAGAIAQERPDPLLARMVDNAPWNRRLPSVAPRIELELGDELEKTSEPALV